MSRVFESLSEWQEFRKSLVGKSLGLVPTMGALHEGHASLIKQSVAENDVTLVSIFVNPTQFNQEQDLKNYPRTWEKDRALVASMEGDFILNPKYEELYSDHYAYQVSEKSFSKLLCGKYRPGHFEGVLTVVLKLLNLAQASRAYFGEKDFQQLKLIEEMVRVFFIPTKVVPMPTVREPDGLAMSSRNLRLSADEREIAPRFAALLKSSLLDGEVSAELARLGFKVDYIDTIEGRRFGAAYLGNVRLIDNVPSRT